MSRRNTAEKARIAGRQIRCAIYTRKSTEEGLDQDFNSLDAQYEACAAYIASQRHESWTLLPARYDDGGFSGGNMDRPGLERLLADVKSGRVDVIVVYKVDRLTRSLTDFAKIVDVLDGAGASFVSITQSFNTTTSMGRLTLNVLLSFAQFEREVISERVRDKVAASKAKGMWMGGVVPLGYDVSDRKLIVNEAEAGTVRHIFRRYLELGSVRDLMVDLGQAGIWTKQQRMRDGSVRGGVPFTRGPLYHLLKNRIYRGEIVHHDKSYPGEHEAIVDAELFNRVQALMAENASDRRSGKGKASPSLLAGMIRDGRDRPLSPTHASKGKVRYRYYASNMDVPGDTDPGAAPVRLPAAPLEKSMRAAFADALDHRLWLDAVVQRLGAGQAERAIIESTRLAQQLREAPAPTCRGLLHTLDLQILIEGEMAIASCSADRLSRMLGIAPPENSARFLIPIAARLRTTGKQTRLIIEPPNGRETKRDPRLVRLLVEAHCARDQLLTRAPDRNAEDAERRRNLTRRARLSYLAPDIVTSILDGRQPEDLVTRKLRRIGDLPLCWTEQRRLLGFG